MLQQGMMQLEVFHMDAATVDGKSCHRIVLWYIYITFYNRNRGYLKNHLLVLGKNPISPELLMKIIFQLSS